MLRRTHAFPTLTPKVVTSGFSSLPVTLALLADGLSPSARPAAFGAALASAALGIVLGPGIGSRMLPAHALLAALSCIALCILAGAALLPTWAAGSETTRRSGVTNTQPSTSLLPAAAFRILMRSRLYRALTVCTMLLGMCSEGVQDLLVQYLQLKLRFGPADQARVFMVVGAGWFLAQALLLRPLLGLLGERGVLLAALGAMLLQHVALTVVASARSALCAVALGTLGEGGYQVGAGHWQ